MSFANFKHARSLELITAFKMCAAGLIAFFLIDYFNLPFGVWSVVTIAAVTQPGLNSTFAKASMRAIGTVLGAIIGYMIAFYAKGDPVIIGMLIFIMIFLVSYFSFQPTIYSYAGIVMNMTISIIVFYALTGQEIFGVAVDRTAEVLLGVAILILLNSILYCVVKKYYPRGITKSTISWQLPQFKFNNKYTGPAFKVALACLITAIIWYAFKQPEGYWAVITCLLIMEENRTGTLKKGLFRFSSHIIATACGFICMLALVNFSYMWRLVPLLITFFICGYLIGTKNKYASMGNTLAIAMAIMLLTDPNTHEALGLIVARFYNVVIGITVAFAVLFFKVPRWIV